MVGPEVEKTGLVRRSARLLTALANATVPIMTVVLRKAYGLGYYIMGSRPLAPGDPAGLADRRVRRHGPGRRGQHHLPARNSRASRIPAARAAVHRQRTEELQAPTTLLSK